MSDPLTAEAELAASLADVRRAFRLAVAYQQRMNALFHKVHLALGDEGVGLDWWAPNRQNPPMKWDKPQFRPTTWAWDLFPGHSLSAEWSDTSAAPARRVWLALDTDTALQAAKARGGEPDPTLFRDDGRTELWAEVCTWANPATPWSTIWPALQPRWREGPDKEWQWAAAGTTGTYTAFCVPVEKLTTPEAADTLLVHRLRDAVRRSP